MCRLAHPQGQLKWSPQATYWQGCPPLSTHLSPLILPIPAEKKEGDKVEVQWARMLEEQKVVPCQVRREVFGTLPQVLGSLGLVLQRCMNEYQFTQHLQPPCSDLNKLQIHFLIVLLRRSIWNMNHLEVSALIVNHYPWNGPIHPCSYAQIRRFCVVSYQIPSWEVEVCPSCVTSGQHGRLFFLHLCRNDTRIHGWGVWGIPAKQCFSFLIMPRVIKFKLVMTVGGKAWNSSAKAVGGNNFQYDCISWKWSNWWCSCQISLAWKANTTDYPDKLLRTREFCLTGMVYLNEHNLHNSWLNMACSRTQLVNIVLCFSETTCATPEEFLRVLSR